MGGEAHAPVSTLCADTNLSFPESILQLPSGAPGDRKGGDGSAHARIGGRGQASFWQTRQSFPEAFGQHGIPTLDALHADPVHESQGRAQPMDYGQAARAVLHETKRTGGLVIEAGAGKGCPNAGLNIFSDVKQAGAFGSQ